MFLSKLFGGSSRLKVRMHLAFRSYVETVHKDKNLNDKDYILFALLVYARILRLLPLGNKEIQIDACKIFVEFDTSVRNKGDDLLYQIEQGISMLSNDFDDVPPLVVTMKTKSIFVGFIPTKQIDKYIYLAFSYAWETISEVNGKLLFKSFVELSKRRFAGQFSPMEVISIPSQVVTALR